MEETCGTCIYHRPFISDRYGYCRRYPPAYSASLADYKYPEINIDYNWCGEYVPMQDDTNISLKKEEDK